MSDDAPQPPDLSYLDQGLHGPEGLLPGLAEQARVVALAWVRLGVDPLSCASRSLSSRYAALHTPRAAVSASGMSLGLPIRTVAAILAGHDRRTPPNRPHPPPRRR